MQVLFECAITRKAISSSLKEVFRDYTWKIYCN